VGKEEHLQRPDSLVRILGVAAAGVLAVAACGQGGGQQTQSLAADQTLKFAIGDDFGTLDPAQLNAESDSEVGQNLFNGLLSLDFS
jgi:ABC-type oligopeptide transport system substrate-binding subunit